LRRVARLLAVPTFCDSRGVLSVVDGLLPFPVRRVYSICRVTPGATRAGHRHRHTRQALLCLAGQCRVTVRRRAAAEDFFLDSPAQALLLEPDDWHLISEIELGTVLLVLASEPYDPADYIAEPCP
jgi:quercetin dioxygenase-like cupin family protein